MRRSLEHLLLFRRRPVISVACVILLAAFVVVAWRPMQFLMMPTWKRNVVLQFPRLAVVPMPETPDGIACAPHEIIRRRLRNDIIRRSQWTMEEANYLDQLIGAGYPSRGVESTEVYEGMYEDMYKVTNQQEAVTLASARIGFGAPIDDDARKVLEQALHDELTHSHEQRRYDAAFNIIYYRAVDTPEIRRWVEAAIPTLSTDHSFIVTKKLRWQDEGAEAVKKYKAIKEGRTDATKP